MVSCDTILFYKRSAGTGKTADFTYGVIRDLRNLPDALGSYGAVVSSCDVLMGEDAGTGE